LSSISTSSRSSGQKRSAGLIRSTGTAELCSQCRHGPT
jgi:hypothetical protein